MILPGLWCSICKPAALSMLEPILMRLKTLDEGVFLRTLYNNTLLSPCMYLHIYICITAGLEVEIPDVGKCVVRAQLLCAVVDLPAKAALLNCLQYNGRYGCSTCKHPGCTVSFFCGEEHYI